MLSSRPRILYVDDDRDSLELIRFLLNSSDARFNVTTVESAAQALELIERERFDLYIFDYRMPEMSGIELCRFLRGKNIVTPVVFFSAMARSIDAAEGINAGANAYLIKPDDLEKLPGIVKQLLDESLLLNNNQAIETCKTITFSAPCYKEQSLQFQTETSENKRRAMAVSENSPQKSNLRLTGRQRLRKIGEINKTKERALKSNQTYPSFPRKLEGKAVFLGIAIFCIIAAQFFTQIFFFQNDRLASNSDAFNKRQMEIKAEDTKKPDTEKIRESSERLNVQPGGRAEPKNERPPLLIRKTEPRRTRADRLRRAERILTGV